MFTLWCHNYYVPYARQQYAKDMERVKLYRDAELLLLREART